MLQKQGKHWDGVPVPRVDVADFQGESFNIFRTRAALREAPLNAIVHKDYSGGSPIQISVYENKIYFWNDGQLPDNWTVEQLLSKHASKPFNPLIANAFFRAGMIESWGRSTIEFLDLWDKLSNPEFKPLKFERFKSEAGNNYFVLSPQRWVEFTHAIRGTKNEVYRFSRIRTYWSYWL